MGRVEPTTYNVCQYTNLAYVISMADFASQAGISHISHFVRISLQRDELLGANSRHLEQMRPSVLSIMETIFVRVSPQGAIDVKASQFL